MRNVLAAALVAIFFSAGTAGAADSYPIRLSVPARVGDSHGITVKVKRHYAQKFTDVGDSRKPVDRRFKAALEGTETVDAVSDRGRPTRVTVVVRRCTKDGVQLLPPDTIIVAQNPDGHAAYKVNGTVASDDVARVLSSLIYTPRPDEPTADEEFGTDQPRKVGESWPANVDQLAKAPAPALPFLVTRRDFKGEAKLADVSVVNGSEVETVDLTQRCEFDSRPGRSGWTYKNLKMTRDIAMSVPVSTPSHGRTDKGTFAVAYTATGPSGTEEIASEETTERTYSDVRK